MLVYVIDMVFYYGGDGWVSYIVIKGGNNLYFLFNFLYYYVI